MTMERDRRLDEANISAILSDPARLRELERLGLLDSFRVDAFDRLTDLAVRSAGCNHGQGFYFSRPVPADAMTAFLSSHAEVTV
jgi:hypothetical protein